MEWREKKKNFNLIIPVFQLSIFPVFFAAVNQEQE